MKSIRSRLRPHLFLVTLFWALLVVTSLPAPPDGFARTGDTAVSLYEKGKELKERKQYDQALEYFKKAVQKKPDFEDAYFAMGVVYYKLNLPGRAIESFQEVLRINPDSRETHNNLAVLYEQQGNYEQAMKELRETVRLDPGYDKGRLNLAKLYFARSIEEYFQVILSNRKEDTVEIRQKLRRLLESDPESPDLQYDLGILNRLEGRLKEAVKNLRDAVRLDPTYGNRVSLELGDLFEKQGRLKEAFEEYARLLKTDSENFAGAFGAGKIKNRMKEYGAAKTFLLKARAIKPSPKVDYELGKAEDGLGQTDEAIVSFKKSLEQADDPEVRWSLSNAYADKQAYTQALEQLESILETYPDRVKVQRKIVEITRLRLAAATPPVEKAKEKKERVTGKVPGPLVGLERENDYALLVDKATQALLLYQYRNGRIAHIKTYACSTGENDGKKSKAGDKKTPEGIYFFTSIKTGRELPPEYGRMAFPLDYPNFYDRKRNKRGNGIWLHSTNEPLRAFLPRKTRGCIVVNDKDIQELSRIVRLYDTPIIIYEKTPYVPQRDQRTLRRKVLKLVSAWRRSWESRDLNRYIGFYSRSFTHDKMDLRRWRRYKRGIFAGTKKIHLKLTPYSVLRHENYLVVTFRQDYRADTYSDEGIKRLFLIRENNSWRILGEEWRKL